MGQPRSRSQLPGRWSTFSSKTTEWVTNGLHGEQSQQLLEVVHPLCMDGLSQAVLNHLLRCLQEHFSGTVFPSFWAVSGAHASQLSPENIQILVAKVRDAIALLEGLVGVLRKTPDSGLVPQALPPPSLLGTSGRLRAWMGSAFLSSSPVLVMDWLETFYRTRIEEFSAAAMSKEDQPVEAVCYAFDTDQWICESHMTEGWFPNLGEGVNGVCVLKLMGEAWLRSVINVGEALRLLNLHDIVEEGFQRAVGNHIRSFLKDKIGKRFRLSFVNGAEGYVHSVPFQFVVLCLPQRLEEERLSKLAWQERVERIMYETLGIMRASQMFDIVMDYPQTQGAITDLRVCMAYTDLHRHFVERFRSALQERLLIPGASTEDIIMQYVSTVKALNDMDPSGSLLDAVGTPIKEYLRTRPDTVRCIVASLIKDIGSEEGTGSGPFLSAELKNFVDETELGDAFEEQNRGPDALALLSIAWKPEKIEVRVDGDDPYSGGRKVKVRQIDIINMLVDIYGSKELFVEQYQSMLADRLLSKVDFNMDKEIIAMELLKRRFGDANLQSCDVMLRDFRDSHRINRNIHEMPSTVRSPVRGRAAQADISPLSAMIMSYLFWPKALQEKPPSLSQDKLILPEDMEDMLEQFEGKYHVLKTPRKLMWQRHMGRLELEVSIGAQSAKFEVSPLEAALIFAFEGQEQRSTQELMRLTGLSSQGVKNGMNFWINSGVVGEVVSPAGSSYVRTASLASGTAGGLGTRSSRQELSMSPAPAEAADAAAAETDVAGMSKYELWIMNMLKTHSGGLDLDSVHNKLCLFVPDYDKSKEELRLGLDAMVAANKLSQNGNLYCKPDG